MSWLSKLSLAREPAPANPKRSEPLDSIVDEFLDSYVSWREACEDVRTAYECWGRCKGPQRTLGFKWYCAALDREEHLARLHSNRADRLRAFVR